MFNRLIHFTKRNILEAHEQLKMSEKEYQGQKPVIKIFFAV